MIQDVINFLSSYWWIFALVALLPFSKLIFGWVFIGDNENGIVIRKWGGGNLPPGNIIATNKESGVWADMLSPGLKFWYWPWMYSVEKQKITEVPVGKVAYIEAIDGKPLDPGVILARVTVSDCNGFQDAVNFLKTGQKGVQLNYIPNGQYRINTKLFKVTICDAVEIPAGKIGIVTTSDGAPLSQNEIAGRIVDGHENFQHAEKFISAGGSRGLQEQVLQSGRYFINDRFAKVEIRELTKVEVGQCAVVNSFIGAKGSDVSGEGFKHGNIVSVGNRGIWAETLDPGLHSINPMLQKVILVPTTNIVLNWDTELTGEHDLDNGLNTITLRSKDGFSFTLKLAQVLHISNKTAPKVIARFGSIENLVNQVLEPVVGTYFRNSAQTRDALEFIDQRTTIQSEAKSHIDAELEKYDIDGVDTLIGEIVPPVELMKIKSEQKIAQEQSSMFDMQKASELRRKDFVASKTAADMEKNRTEADYGKQIAQLNADANVITNKGNAEAAKAKADGDAYVFTTVGTAQAKNITEVGAAEAGVILKKTEAMGQEQFAIVQVFEQISKGNIKITPEILVQGASGGDSGVSGMLASLLGSKMLEGGFQKISDQTKVPAVKDKEKSPDSNQSSEIDEKK